MGCYLHLSVFPATSNLLMVIKEQRGPHPDGNGPCIHNHPELKPLFDKNQEDLAGRRTTCKPPATHTGLGMDGCSRSGLQHAAGMTKWCLCFAEILGEEITAKTSNNNKKKKEREEQRASCISKYSV